MNSPTVTHEQTSGRRRDDLGIRLKNGLPTREKFSANIDPELRAEGRNPDWSAVPWDNTAAQFVVKPSSPEQTAAMEEKLKHAICARISAARSHAKLTQEQLAEKTGRSVEAISNIERGISLPTLETIDRIAKAVAVPIDYFFRDMMQDGDMPNADLSFELGLIVPKLSSRDAALLLTLARNMLVIQF